MTEAPVITYAGPTVYQAINEVMEEVRAVGKEGRNTQQGYNFRGIDAVVNAAGPAFRRHGIVPTPHWTEANYRDVQTTTGKPSREVTVIVTYRFYGPGGDYIEATVPGESMDQGDKGSPKAMSVAYRIALLQVLCIPTDDVDPDAQSYERASEPARNWLAEAEALNTVDALKALGNDAHKAGVWKGTELEKFVKAKVEALEKPITAEDPDVEKAAQNLADAGLTGGTPSE